jgi:hypothetical protein
MTLWNPISVGALELPHRLAMAVVVAGLLVPELGTTRPCDHLPELDNNRDGHAAGWNRLSGARRIKGRHGHPRSMRAPAPSVLEESFAIADGRVRSI